MSGRRDASFEEFVRGSSARLLRSAYLLVGDVGVAEDLLQEVLERMYVSWPGIEDPDAYARRALVHRATNRWRSRRRRPEVALTEGHDRALALDGPETRLDVVRVLRELSAGQRAVIVLRYLDDLSVEQTAAAMGCSVGTVKSQTARALPRLRALLESPVTCERTP